jgi:phosphohistidine phosphatase
MLSSRIWCSFRPRRARATPGAWHNPGLRDLAEFLIASGDVDARQRLLEKFPTAGLAVIDFPVDDWGKLHPKSGRLDRFVAPRQLDLATD